MIRPKLKRQENTIDKKKGERVNNVKYYVTLLGCKKSVNNIIKGLPQGLFSAVWTSDCPFVR